MEIKACNSRDTVDVEFTGHTVQIGQVQVDTADRHHAGQEEVHVSELIPGYLGRGHTMTQVGETQAAQPLPLTAALTFPSTATGGWYSSVCQRPNRPRSFWLCSWGSASRALRARLEKPFTIYQEGTALSQEAGRPGVLTPHQVLLLTQPAPTANHKLAVLFHLVYSCAASHHLQGTQLWQVLATNQRK